MRRPIILATSILMIVAADGFAQPTEQDPTVRELLNQLAEMRSQMVTMQNRIATLEAAKAIPEIRSQPDEAKTAAEPTALHFKGLTLTPGGFRIQQL
jgi:type II secretory pathway component PulJ